MDVWIYVLCGYINIIEFKIMKDFGGGERIRKRIVWCDGKNNKIWWYIKVENEGMEKCILSK